MSEEEVVDLAEKHGACFSPAKANLDWDIGGLKNFVEELERRMSADKDDS
jgi:hypothetical protein